MIISSFYHVSLTEIYRIMSKSNMMIKIKILCCDQNIILMCSLCIQYHIQYDSRPYSRWLSRFMWLFYYFNIFYWPKYTELYQNLIWWSKSQYYDYDQIVIIACTLQIMQNAFRPYPGWLSWFRWLFHRFTMFHWPKYTELCQNLTWYM